MKYGYLGTKTKSVSLSVRQPERHLTDTLNMNSVNTPFWEKPATGFFGTFGTVVRYIPPKHILNVSACLCKCPGWTKNQANLPVLHSAISLETPRTSKQGR